MTAQDLILLDKGKVRRDSNLMSLYLAYFKEAYGYTPSCAGCSFGTDWQKIVLFYSKKQEKTLNLPKENFMAITIKKIQGKILSYKKDGKTFRLYDNILNPEFIYGYLNYGSEDELIQRKKLFNFPKITLELTDESEFESEGSVMFNFTVEEPQITIEETDLKEFEKGVTLVIPKKRGRKSKK